MTERNTRGVRVPVEDALGECYHAVGGCGGHNVTQETVSAQELADRGLRPCRANGCKAADIPLSTRCDGCGLLTFDRYRGPGDDVVAWYCPDCRRYLKKHPDAVGHVQYELRDPEVATDGGRDVQSTSDTEREADRYWAECGTCGRVIIETDGTTEGHDRAVDVLADHIDDGSACHGGRVMADGPGGEWRAL